MSKFIDKTGQRFGRLVVVDRAENNHRGLARWLCQCDCGNTHVVLGALLASRTRGTKSCGCLKREAVSARMLGKRYTKGRPRTGAEKERIGAAQRGTKHHMYGKRHTEESRAKMRAAALNRTHPHPRYYVDRNQAKLSRKIRRYMGHMVRRTLTYKKTSTTREILGYTKDHLRLHIEDQWEEGMTWQNYGSKGWVIDHVVPISYLIKNGITNPKIINALDNLAPLWADENRRKSDKVTWDIN